MNRLRWQAVRLGHSLGLPGWAALGLLVLMAVWLLIDLLPTARRSDRLEAQALMLARQAPSQPVAVASPESIDAQLARFHQRLGDAAGIGRSLHRIHAAAARQGLQLPQGDFRLLHGAAEPVARYTMDLTLSADYRALRRFLRDVLSEQPALGLESLHLQRAESQPGQVDARLRLVLFMRPAPGAKS